MDKWRDFLKKEEIWYKLESFRRLVWEIRNALSWQDIAFGLGIAVFFAFFFYRSAWAVAPMLPVGGVFVYYRQQKRMRRKKQQLLLEFKECVLSVAASLKAGYAVENAFEESIGDMEAMFGKECQMLYELEKLRRGLKNNETLENLLQDMARRSGQEEIREFAQVFAIAKRNSGNIPDTIELYSKIITGKLELEAELQTLLAAKQLEQKVMNVMPFFIVLYLEYSNPGYFDMMYHSLFGVAMMTACLVIYLCAFGLSERILRKACG